MENTFTLETHSVLEEAAPPGVLEFGADDMIGGGPKGKFRESPGRQRRPSSPRRVRTTAHEGSVEDVGREFLTVGEVLRAVMEQVNLVARTDYPVLLLGELGTGKAVIAKALHERSLRSHAELFRINCGALAQGDADAELFGSELPVLGRLPSPQVGLLERAYGATVVLEDVGKLPRWTQAKLLAVMQEGKLERVGGVRSVPIDVRVVATIHDTATSGLDNHGLRPDLWYTLNVFPIRVPALRERRRDIPALATMLARAVGERLFGAPLFPTAADLERLAMHDWPGNLRELAAVIEQAAVLGAGRRLDTRRGLRNTRALGKVAGGKQDDGFVTLNQCIRGHIREALVRTESQIDGPVGAARLLGVQTRALIMEMRRLGLEGSIS